MPRPIPKDRQFPWQQKKFQTVQEAAVLLCCSQSKIYDLIKRGKLSAVRLPSARVAVATADIEDMFATAEPWRPSRT